MQDFDFRLEYLPGPLNICADGLSRIGVDDRDMLISIADVLPAHAAEQSLLNGQSVPYRSLNNIYANKKRGHDRQQLRTAAETVWNAHADEDTEDESAEPTQHGGRAPLHPIRAQRQSFAKTLPHKTSNKTSMNQTTKKGGNRTQKHKHLLLRHLGTILNQSHGNTFQVTFTVPRDTSPAAVPERMREAPEGSYRKPPSDE